MTVLTDKADIKKIRQAGKIIREIFEKIETSAKEGASTLCLDKIAEEVIRKRGALAAFKGYKGYPATICASLNSVVVHGIPSDRVILKAGDIISVDLGLKKDGFFVDAAKTYAVGRIDPKTGKLIEAAEEALAAGIKEAVAGNRVSDISHAIFKTVEKFGFYEVRSFVGHGIGRQLHEEPEVPNWGEPGRGRELKTGLLLAIEPMVNAGTREVKVLGDGWTAVTADGSLSSHFEHTIMVGDNRAEILT